MEELKRHTAESLLKIRRSVEPVRISFERSFMAIGTESGGGTRAPLHRRVQAVPQVDDLRRPIDVQPRRDLPTVLSQQTAFSLQAPPAWDGVPWDSAHARCADPAIRSARNARLIAARQAAQS